MSQGQEKAAQAEPLNSSGWEAMSQGTRTPESLSDSNYHDLHLPPKKGEAGASVRDQRKNFKGRPVGGSTSDPEWAPSRPCAPGMETLLRLHPWNQASEMEVLQTPPTTFDRKSLPSHKCSFCSHSTRYPEVLWMQTVAHRINSSSSVWLLNEPLKQLKGLQGQLNLLQEALVATSLEGRGSSSSSGTQAGGPYAAQAAAPAAASDTQRTKSSVYFRPKVDIYPGEVRCRPQLLREGTGALCVPQAPNPSSASASRMTDRYSGTSGGPRLHAVQQTWLAGMLRSLMRHGQYFCHECGKSFSQPSHMRTHMRSHTVGFDFNGLHRGTDAHTTASEAPKQVCGTMANHWAFPPTPLPLPLHIS
ncbi:zinc finger protein 516-like isoform X2 [Lates japonicus]|uniref:Zinc finger protein 516-like isoform X2 n=1 Tax=Lates japonicus TaxID=270547 RepID=A0AAD3RHT8_LATJO|nr:zinc finger protein 516-like isoform X2 [Lates japonicus]